MKKTVKIDLIFDDNEPEYCGTTCPHSVEYTKYPPIGICKLCGIELVPDSNGKVSRLSFCKYIAGEEVEDHFWSPMKGR